VRRFWRTERPITRRNDVRYFGQPLFYKQTSLREAFLTCGNGFVASQKLKTPWGAFFNIAVLAVRNLTLKQLKKTDFVRKG